MMRGVQWRLTKDVVAALAEYGPYVHHGHRNSRSVYIHFTNLPNGLTHKVRISDHPERERYGYKWQLRIGGLFEEEERKPHSRYYDKVETLVLAFKAYYTRVSESAANAKKMGIE